MINQSVDFFVHWHGWCFPNQPAWSTTLTFRGSTPIITVPCRLRWIPNYRDLLDVRLTVHRVVRGIVLVFGILRRCIHLLSQIVQRVIMFTVTEKRHIGQSIGQLWHFIYLISLSEQYRLYKKNYFRHSPHEHVNSQLEHIFSKKFPSERWTIVEPSLTRDGRHGIAMPIDGSPGNVLTIGELHWSLSTSTPFSASVSKKYTGLFVRYHRE